MAAVNPRLTGQLNLTEAFHDLAQHGVYPGEPKRLEDVVVMVRKRVPTCEPCDVVALDRSKLREV